MAITAPDWKAIGKGVPRYKLNNIDRGGFQRSVNTPGSVAYQAVQAFGSLDAYKKAVEEYEKLYAQYESDFYAERAKQAASDPTATESYKRATQKKALSVETAEAKAKRLYDTNYKTVRSELENQYNNLVKFDPKLSYQGRSSDLPAIFNQQAAQLASAGVTSVANLKVQNGKLVDSATGKTVSTSNLGGQVAVDRDTGVQKWGDIFSGVKGGANYGIQSLQDGSVVLFPAWEKTKSPIAQIGLGGLESVITPLLTVGGALIGVPGLGAVGGAAAGAAAGNSAGQLLASGSIDWEKVALSAAGAGAGQAAFGGAGAQAPAAAEAGATAATSTAVPGSFQAALPGLGVQTAATTAGATAVPGSFAAALPGLVAPVGVLDLPSYGLLDTTDFSRVGETGITGAPSTSGSVFDPFATAAPGVGEGIMVIPPSVAGGAATVAGLEAPGLSSMGGAQGITVPVQGGGVVSEMGFVPPGATPSLGDPGSFINNPDYLGSPVISEDYLGLTASDMPGGMNIQDALRMARTGMQLFGPQQQQLLGMGGYGGGGGQAAGVDASGLLALLQGRAGVPGVSPLLTPVSIPAAQVQPLLGLQMPQYQPLLGTTTQSLLG
jgi:hypothetical protein